MTRTIHNETLDLHIELAGRPMRIVSLLSFATEVLDRMGLIDRVVGVSAYCHRYVPEVEIPVVGEYLNCDIEQIKSLGPDLILTTGGIQRKLAAKLAGEGLPVYVLPLPQSFHGILENILVLGGLMNELARARQLVASMTREAGLIRQNAPASRPRLYLELWLGRHMRAVGGGSFIHDLVDIAGGELLFSHLTDGYFIPDFNTVADLAPDVFLFFHEPEFVVDPPQLVRERDWNPDTPVITSTIECGKNVIQEGPSFLDTARWLQGVLPTL